MLSPTANRAGSHHCTETSRLIKHSRMTVSCCFHLSGTTMKIETALSSATMETINKTTRRQNPEDKYLNKNSREKVQSYKCNEV
jgi:hypothetical protein